VYLFALRHAKPDAEPGPWETEFHGRISGAKLPLAYLISLIRHYKKRTIFDGTYYFQRHKVGPVEILKYFYSSRTKPPNTILYSVNTSHHFYGVEYNIIFGGR
jgi:hypothetical protein